MAATTKANKEAEASLFDMIFEAAMPIKVAFLHQALTAPGVPAERTLAEGMKFPGLEMRVNENVLLMKFKGKKVGVPITNVANWLV